MIEDPDFYRELTDEQLDEQVRTVKVMVGRYL
jgi:hypothetical protein